MATTKKTGKKATTKRAYNRKAPVQKRAYNRKPKEEVASPVNEVQEDTAVKQDPNSNAGDEQSAQSTGSILREIQVIDLRGQDVLHRVAILAMLQDEGYINEQLESPLNSGTISQELFADALKLNHNNKIVSFEKWDNVAGSYRISRSMMRHETYISFSKPEPNHEQVMRIGEAVYVRVQ